MARKLTEIEKSIVLSHADYDYFTRNKSGILYMRIMDALDGDVSLYVYVDVCNTDELALTLDHVRVTDE